MGQFPGMVGQHNPEWWVNMVRNLQTFKDGTTETHYVPLNLMYGQKPKEGEGEWFVYPAQRWTHRELVITSKRKLSDVSAVEIDPSQRMADLERRSNKLEIKW